ncbi:S-formylglutathione hydrolase, partial [Acinetobacter baumannii]|nr:S-formylglutathione hydrolase [Acinetobacter baumannii]
MTTSATPELLSRTRSFGGWLERYRHRSQVLGCEMVFAVYLPPAVEKQSVP